MQLSLSFTTITAQPQIIFAINSHLSNIYSCPLPQSNLFSIFLWMNALSEKTYIWSSHPYLKEAFLILNRFKSLTLSTNPGTHFWSIPGSLLYQAHSQQYTLQLHCLHLDTPISFQVLYLHSLQSGFSQVMNSFPHTPFTQLSICFRSSLQCNFICFLLPYSVCIYLGCIHSVTFH